MIFKSAKPTYDLIKKG